MLQGRCLILFTEEIEYLADEDGVIMVFRNEAEARQYAEKEGFTNYDVAGLLDSSVPEFKKRR